jgi:hypothetical protein
MRQGNCPHTYPILQCINLGKEEGNMNFVVC